MYNFALKTYNFAFLLLAFIIFDKLIFNLNFDFQIICRLPVFWIDREKLVYIYVDIVKSFLYNSGQGSMVKIIHSPFYFCLFI